MTLSCFDGLKEAIQGDVELTGFFCTSRTERLDNRKRPEYMPKKGFTPEAAADRSAGNAGQDRATGM
jgi:hypothetical protein